MNLPGDVAAEFRHSYGSEPQHIVRAPGRVNLIGEHTDYNDGWVLPMAIDREVRIALRRREDRRVRVRAMDLGEEAEFDLAELQRGEGWAEYLKGVAWSLASDGLQPAGFEGTMSGNVPRGSGLSSSAALELATARAFALVSPFEWDEKRMALACQRAENEWLGVSSGIMDQLVSGAGREGHALLIDCRSLETTAVPLPADTTVLVLDTGTRRQLVGSAYNERRRQCEDSARRLGVPSLRDASLELLASKESVLPDVLLRRARHVISENGRTLQAAEAMSSGDPATLGRLMDQSHESLREDYEVSSKALDAIVAAARSQEGCHGARLTGAGFGGCAVALFESRAAARAVPSIADYYRQETGLEATIYVCRASAGAGRLEAG